MTSVLLSITDEAGVGLGDLWRGPASSTVTLWVVCTSWHHPPPAQQLAGGVLGRTGAGEETQSCRGACEDNRASGEAEPPPVASLVPILAQEVRAEHGEWQSWGQRGPPVPPRDPSAWSSSSLSHSPVPGAVTATLQAVLECPGELGT